MNLDHHFPPPRYRATQRERYSAAAALRQQEDSMDFNPRGEPQRVTRIPDGCDQQGRYPEADPAWREYAADRAMKTVPPPAAAADNMDGAAGQDDDRMPPKGAPIPVWIKGIGIAALLVTAAWLASMTNAFVNVFFK